MRGPTTRGLLTWLVTSVVVAVLGPPAGLLWAKIVPKVTYVVLQGQPLLADPEGEGPVGIDGRFALIGLGAGLLCGVLAYLAGRRLPDVPLIIGLAVGGIAAALLARWTGHMIGLGHFHDAVRQAKDGTNVTGVADLRARGVLVCWPLLAVAAYGLLELVVKRLPAGDAGQPGAGEADQVGGGDLDLQSAPAGRDVDGGER